MILDSDKIVITDVNVVTVIMSTILRYV